MAEALTTAPPRPKEPPYFSLVEFRNGALVQECQMCGEPTLIEMTKHRGAKAFRPLPYCLGDAWALRDYFLKQGTIVKVDTGSLDKQIIKGQRR